MGKTMKILTVTWTIYDDRMQEFAENRTGGGLIIKNLCEEIGKYAESYLLEWAVDIKDTDIGKIHLVDNGENRKYKGKERIDKSLETFEQTVNRIHPDIVNFQGISEISIHCMDICDKYNIPYTYTEHLFFPRDKVFKDGDVSLKWQQDLYKKQNLNIIAISTGMKKKIQKDFPELSSKNIKVIPNGTDFHPDLQEKRLSDSFGIKGKKVLLCVGSICERKNQLCLVNTFLLLKKEIQNKVAILFLGNDRLDGKLQQSIAAYGLEDSLIYAGAVSNEEMKNYYAISEGLIMPSYAEGLSIAALEILTYGKPVILFSDSECADDFDDKKVRVLADRRTDAALAEAIEKWYFEKWDSKYIKKFSDYFTIERMGKNYMDYFQELLTQGKMKK